MRSAHVLGVSSVFFLALLVPACGGDDKPGAVVAPADSGGNVDTSVLPVDAGDSSVADGETDSGASDSTPSDSTLSDSALADSADGTVTDAPVDTGVFFETGAGVDTGAGIDTGATTITDATIPDVFGDDAGPLDTAPVPDASPALVPVNKPCTTSAECDPTGAKVGICSNAQAAPDAVDPNPVCMALACESGTSGIGKPCGLGGAGLCVGGGASGRCIARCSFGSTGAATGCVGKNACRQYTWERSAGAVNGIGYCTGGCAADADCPSGQKCQTEDGFCVATLFTYTKPLGSSCTSSATCPCKLNPSTGLGYCIKYCKTGDSTATCPSGFTCDPDLPATDSGGVLFSGVATGMAGTCYKNCTNDSECTPLGGHCESNTATGVKVCQVP